MSDEILPGPLCCDAWFTYVYVGVCSGPPLANRVCTSSIEPVHPATNSIPHHVTSSCAPFGRLCGDAWCRCILRVRDLMRNCQCSICKMCFVVTCRRGMFHTTWHSCVRTTCLESGMCPTSPCTSRCGFARHRPTQKNCPPPLPAPLGGQAVALPSLGWLSHWQSMPQSLPAAITDPLVLTPRRHGRAPHL